MMRIVLFSGGLDSACLLYHLKATLDEDETKPMAIFIDYGQKNKDKELSAVTRLCSEWNVKLHIIDCSKIFNSVNSAILKTSSEEHGVLQDELPNRNAVLISIAASHVPIYEEAVIYVAAHKTSAPYADATRQFYTRMNRLISYSTTGRVSVEAPFINMTKYALTKQAYMEGISKQELEHTVSCYEGTSCGRCPACINRKEVLDKLFY